MPSEIHNHALFVNQDIERDSLAKMENRVKAAPLGISKMEIFNSQKSRFHIIGPVVQIEIDNAERRSLVVGGQTSLEWNFLPTRPAPVCPYGDIDNLPFLLGNDGPEQLKPLILLKDNGFAVTGAGRPSKWRQITSLDSLDKPS